MRFKFSVASLRGGGQLSPSLPTTVPETRPDSLRYFVEGYPSLPHLDLPAVEAVLLILIYKRTPQAKR